MSAALTEPPADRVTVLTAAGASGLAIVRLSGPLTPAFFARHFSRPLAVGRCVHGDLRDEQGVVDDPVCVLDADGSVDVTLHGNPWIVALVVDLATRSGFAYAVAPAETIEDEVRDGLPLARTERAARMLLAQPAAWLAMEADDVEAMRRDRALHHLLHPPTVAIVGVPNAGKSTLANALFGTRRSIVSDAAGTTRDWVGEPADLDGLVVTLVDTPGLRVTADAIERAAIAGSAGAVAAADVVVLLLDATRDDAEQQALRARFDRAVVVANKTDVAAAPIDAIPLIARDGVGLDALVRAIHDRLGLNDRPERAPRIWTDRQRATIA